jgi:preprotein translocase subunit SecE
VLGVQIPPGLPNILRYEWLNFDGLVTIDFGSDILQYRSTMARLLRKKTASNRKKSKQNIDTPDTSKDTGNILKKSITIAGVLAETKKIHILPQKKPLTGSKTVADKETNNHIEKISQFLREVKIELKKITWPTRKQTIGSTIVVIILVMIVSLFLGVVDMGLSSLVHIILQ